MHSALFSFRKTLSAAGKLKGAEKKRQTKGDWFSCDAKGMHVVWEVRRFTVSSTSLPSSPSQLSLRDVQAACVTCRCGEKECIMQSLYRVWWSEGSSGGQAEIRTRAGKKKKQLTSITSTFSCVIMMADMCGPRHTENHAAQLETHTYSLNAVPANRSKHRRTRAFQHNEINARRPGSLQLSLRSSLFLSGSEQYWQTQQKRTTSLSNIHVCFHPRTRLTVSSFSTIRAVEKSILHRPLWKLLMRFRNPWVDYWPLLQPRSFVTHTAHTHIHTPRPTPWHIPLHSNMIIHCIMHTHWKPPHRPTCMDVPWAADIAQVWLVLGQARWP